MYIAMNRFRVRKGSEEAFEHVWLSRDTYLHKVPGFVEFHLLKGPEHDDHTLYSSHTVWQSRASFEAWTRSEEFRAAHRDAGQNSQLYLDHPQFEGFEVRQTVRRVEPEVLDVPLRKPASDLPDDMAVLNELCVPKSQIRTY